MPVKVWREVVKMQRSFLWGGLSIRKRICWVKWTDICKPKKEGGLGIRDLRLVNISLLAKWHWKLLVESDELWKVVVAKYGVGALGNVGLEGLNPRPISSVWWGEICRLDKGIGWFSQVAVKKLGNGNSIKFWKDVWVGEQCLAQRFSRLFGISVQQDEFIRNVGSWVNGEWRWGLSWRKNFFVWEQTLVQELLDLISNVAITDADDGWIWIPERVEGFLVKSLYVYLDRLLSPQNQRTSLENFAFNYIWKSGVPSKVSALVWQLFLDRLPTRDNLCHRGVIRSDDVFCPLCTMEVESSRHLFFALSVCCRDLVRCFEMVRSGYGASA
ncbi:putative ribonuclease H protein [Trifolium medium]|uniref:Putative ribonuclease H protein n=1 Tax=Trifolium medium TaxID=97028 RepID=A0A392M114_9FABA|nr:putative ribonuclease H protein [Trifolium medium]